MQNQPIPIRIPRRTGDSCVDISEKVVKNTAELAQLVFSDEDLTVISGSMSEILALVEQMQEVNTSDVVPMSHPLDATQWLRPDEVTESSHREEFQKLAPETRDGLYLVPRVVD